MQIISFTTRDEKGWQAPRVGALLNEEYLLDFFAAFEGEPPLHQMSWLDMDGGWFKQCKDTYEALLGDPRKIAEAADQRRLTRRGDAYWFAPIPRPGKLICIGLNYRDHAIESGQPIPERPIVFSKFSSAVIGPGEPVIVPDSSSQVDYEAELAVVIGRRAKNVKAEHALEYVLGYTAFNDVSARDFQFTDGQWQRGKSCDTFAPMGPVIVTADQIPDPHRLGIKLVLNGKTMQDSNTDQLVFGVPQLIEFISRTITLEPGDVIATGTPPGVGFARKPPIFLQPGDKMEVQIERIGTLNNPIVAPEEAGSRLDPWTLMMRETR